MAAYILDGKTLAERIQQKLKGEFAALKKKTGQVPRIVNMMLGEDPGSCAYANSQKRAAEEIGIDFALLNLSPKIPQAELSQEIRRLNADREIHGIIIQKPFPAHLDYQAAANCLDMRKDIEGINLANVGKMLLGDTRMIPCTPAAVMEHIRSTGVTLRGKEGVIVGASEIVGKPLSLLMLQEYITVTVCHIATSEAGRLAQHVARADILVVAVGKAGLIKGAWIKKGAVVIDVGINRVGERVVGDVEFSAAQEKAGFITPVPGGVGPVTVMMLMRNAIEAFRQQQEAKA